MKQIHEQINSDGRAFNGNRKALLVPMFIAFCLLIWLAGKGIGAVLAALHALFA